MFEASHIYRIKDRQQFLTLIEAQGGHGWRTGQGLSRRTWLEGSWQPLTAPTDETFASLQNVDHPGQRLGTDSISHGELIRSGNRRASRDRSLKTAVSVSRCSWTRTGDWKPYACRWEYWESRRSCSATDLVPHLDPAAIEPGFLIVQKVQLFAQCPRRESNYVTSKSWGLMSWVSYRLSFRSAEDGRRLLPHHPRNTNGFISSLASGQSPFGGKAGVQKAQSTEPIGTEKLRVLGWIWVIGEAKVKSPEGNSLNSVVTDGLRSSQKEVRSFVDLRSICPTSGPTTGGSSNRTRRSRWKPRDRTHRSAERCQSSAMWLNSKAKIIGFTPRGSWAQY